MAGKYISANLHFVWSTKERRQLLNPEWEERLYAYIGAIVSAKGGKLMACGGQPDHIHPYVSMPSTLSIAEMVNAIKSNSTRWVRRMFDRRFQWQEGYGAFSVSKSVEQTVISYIKNQDKHHKRIDFKREFLALLKRHGIAYDPRHIWD
ncbi:MAG TPA: IS200/IS605 family transposase [Acidobacteriota bacterium]|jgi:REP element-mobilizing transposase RayT